MSPITVTEIREKGDYFYTVAFGRDKQEMWHRRKLLLFLINPLIFEIGSRYVALAGMERLNSGIKGTSHHSQLENRF